MLEKLVPTHHFYRIQHKFIYFVSCFTSTQIIHTVLFFIQFFLYNTGYVGKPQVILGQLGVHSCTLPSDPPLTTPISL